MSVKQQTPQIRFNAFSEDWVERKIRDIGLEFSGGGTPDTRNSNYWKGDIPWLQSSDVEKGNLLSVKPRKYISSLGLNNSAAKMITADAIAIVTRVGVGKVSLIPYSYSTSQDFLSISKLKIDPLFAVFVLSIFMKVESTATQGTSIKGITNEVLLKKSIYSPNDKSEQIAIGNFFQNIDQTIDLKRQKYQQTQTLKKSLLSKMFPKVGQSQPEIRLEGFSGYWVEVKLEDIGEFNPSGILPNNFKYVDLESVSGTELLSSREESKEQAPSRAQRLAKKGDVFYQAVRPYQRNNYLFDLPYIDFVFSTGYIQIRPYISSYFLLNYIQKDIFVADVLRECTGTGYPAISTSSLKKIAINVPLQSNEQTAIGEFFKQFDDTLTLQAKQLKTLENIKKALLAKMFV